MGTRRWWLAAGGVVLGLAALAVLALQATPRSPVTPAPAPVRPAVLARPAPAPPAPPSSEAISEGETPPEPTPQGPRSPVDLAVLKRQLPDNLYWTLGVQTDDPVVLAERARADRKWNVQFGKIQSGEASEEELRDYFEHQRRLHQDYLDFSAHVLNQYGEQLSERDRGLFELGVRMNKDRLDELPRLESEALARKQVQDRKRADWEANGKR
jgi:hypothetical protein